MEELSEGLSSVFLDAKRVDATPKPFSLFEGHLIRRAAACVPNRSSDLRIGPTHPTPTHTHTQTHSCLHSCAPLLTSSRRRSLRAKSHGFGCRFLLGIEARNTSAWLARSNVERLEFRRRQCRQGGRAVLDLASRSARHLRTSSDRSWNKKHHDEGIQKPNQ